MGGGGRGEEGVEAEEKGEGQEGEKEGFGHLSEIYGKVKYIMTLIFILKNRGLI